MKSLILSILAVSALTVFFQRHHHQDAVDPDDIAHRLLRRSEHAMALYQRGNFTAARANFVAVSKQLSQFLGPRDPATLTSRSNLSAALFALGNFDAAEAGHESVMKLRERVLGRRHPDSLASRENLALTQFTLGKFEDALDNASRVAEVRLKVYGAHHPDYREAVRLKTLIEAAIQDGGSDAPRGGPSGLRPSSTGTA
jgi:tetratricopeptide (TPR) repeat protein